MTFAVDLAAFGNLLSEKLKRLEKGIVIGLGEDVVMRSPVGDPDNWRSEDLRLWAAEEGYVGGRFRANWQYGLSQRPLGDLPDIDATGMASLTRIAQGVRQVTRVGNVHYLTNNLPYAQDIEDGHSWNQAPNGVVDLAVTHWQQIANEQARMINA
jgi:hypothetical protein